MTSLAPTLAGRLSTRAGGRRARGARVPPPAGRGGMTAGPLLFAR
jgi:hypothetical protein